MASPDAAIGPQARLSCDGGIANRGVGGIATHYERRADMASIQVGVAGVFLAQKKLPLCCSDSRRNSCPRRPLILRWQYLHGTR
jgi:hypothetical protein